MADDAQIRSVSPMANDSIRAGDVLLFHGTSFVSWAIRRFDGSDVNHAAIATDGVRMIEATSHGLRKAVIEGAIAGNERTYVRRLTSVGDLDPVLVKARAFLASGVPYAYQQIVLLAFLALSRKLPFGNRLLRRALRVALDRAAQLLNALTDSGTGLMICSEYVFRCYEDTRDSRYHLEILPPDQRPQALGAVPGEVRLLDWARERAEPEPVPETAALDIDGDPDAIAEEAEIELEPLIRAYAREVAPEDPQVLATPSTPEPLGSELEVDDDDLHRAASRFREAAIANAEARGIAPAALGLDPWGTFETVADFVTPGDLLYCSPLQDIAELP